MSDHGHAESTEGHGDHHDDYLGVPANEAGPGEPSTPGWLTLLGMGLVLATMLRFVITRPDGKTRAELSPSASASGAAPAPAPSPNPEAARPARPALDAFRPAGNQSAAVMARPAPSGAAKLGRPGPFAVSPGGGAVVAPVQQGTKH